MNMVRATRLAMAIAIICGLTILCWRLHGPTQLDVWLLNGYSPVETSASFRIASVITELGSPGVAAGLGLVASAFLWFRLQSRLWALACLAAPGAAGAVEAAMKVIVHRSRPVTALLTDEMGNGFPSGHAAGFAALAAILAFAYAGLSKRQRSPYPMLFALSSSAVMAVTRVVVGAHYPTDVLAGLVLGLGVADVCAFIVANLAGRKVPGFLTR